MMLKDITDIEHVVTKILFVDVFVVVLLLFRVFVKCQSLSSFWISQFGILISSFKSYLLKENSV